MVNTTSYNQQSSLIFLHIPKTAGTSLRKIVERFYEKKEICFIYATRKDNSPDINDFKTLSDAEKIKVKVFYGHFSFGVHNYIPQPCSYVTILRDPVERVISLFFHVSKSTNHPYYSQFNFDNITIADFVQKGMTLEADNQQTRFISGIEAEFGKCTTEMLETAKENLRKYFIVVGLSEYFDESVLLMKKVFGWKVSFRMAVKKMISGIASPYHEKTNVTVIDNVDVSYYPNNKSPYYEKTNVTIIRPHKGELSIDDLNAIKKFNELDIQLYNYAEKLFQEQINKQGTSFRKELEKLKSLRAKDEVFGWK